MSTPGLQAIHAVGGVVPPSLLARIQAGEVTSKGSLDPATYHLVGRETVRDAASRAWTYLRGAWTAWRDFGSKQPPGTPGTNAARERWLLILLRELGYGRVPALASGYTIDERHYPVSHSWDHVPIHLLGPEVNLNQRNAAVAGAERPPQAMVQELLNRSSDHLWALVSNGLRLRLLRDSTALAGSAYLEFDLETIFEGELYSEFLLLFQLCHVSRLEKREGPQSSPADCWMEAWRGEAVDAGTRALDRLRNGVEAALVALGTGFLHHPANISLVAALSSGALTKEQFRRALLRLAYRLLFIFVTEDRDALLDPQTPQAARDRYMTYFSTARLRRISRVRAGASHGDLWHAQRLVLLALGDHGHPGLGLPALAGLFDPDPRLPNIEGHTDLLLGYELSNEDLLSAVRKLAWMEIDGLRAQPVDYRNLGAEELGSVYESLLELVPDIDLADRTFRLTTVAGNERKSTGSYYTPPSLVSALLDSALDPLLDEAVMESRDAFDAERRLLALTVCDPACGSGHFLVAAARRIARRLAQVRFGDDEPTPDAVRHALREVIGSCIYGVDLNDLAAELAKVSLWLEALEPGKPLGFLDARIRVGNSLLGATPKLLEDGVPDAAFKDLEGDDKKVAAATRKRNKESRGGQGMLLFGQTGISHQALVAERAAALALIDNVDAVREQAQRWAAFQESPNYRGQKVHADAWCAAFVWPLTTTAPEAPVDAVVRAIKTNPFDPGLNKTVEMVDRLGHQYRFFHWHLEFPEIFAVAGQSRHGAAGWTGGFSCLIGNPPWERIKLQEKEFFAGRDEEIANAPNASARKKLIAALEISNQNGDRALYREWTDALRASAGFSQFIRESTRYPLTATGDINTYAIFAEAFRSLVDAHGLLGMIVPTGVATDSTTQRFFRDTVTTNTLVSLYDFENEDKLFPGVDHRFRFALLSLSGLSRRIASIRLVFRVRQPDQIVGRSYSLTPEEITLLNPNTGTCPVFNTRRDAEITLGIYQRVPVLWGPDGNLWQLTFMAMFHMANDSGNFSAADDLLRAGWMLDGNVYRRGSDRRLPLYEAKMAHQFDHRFSTYAGATQEQLNVGTLPRMSDSEHIDPARVPLPRYWVPQELIEKTLTESSDRSMARWDRDWLLGWRKITNTGNERTFVSLVLPLVGVADSAFVLLPKTLLHIAPLYACLSSFVVDFCTRQKASGSNLNYFVIRQLAVLPPETYDRFTPWENTISLDGWITQRVLELTYTSYDIAGYGHDLGYDGAPFVWDTERRTFMRSELDAAYFHLYGVERDDVDHILDTFKVLRERDEKTHGEYRTKRLILQVYDAMQKAIDTGVAYQSIVDPPPGRGPRHPARSVTENGEA
ncbi:Eco57I restriction-modification methylase domain-containing protein [Catelliglobosispora koreensis]|uniref:Eco57I restriction-modification methylase domain-containing protein n=1 Tax=Catelliglobosispora koreensis TaxID=129052 RepID=UPI00037F026B|nr:DNA methyltransferase [Catelliglobosispora koreensis]